MSILSRILLAFVGAVMTGGIVFVLVQVGTADEPDGTIPTAVETTTTSSPSSITTTPSTTATSSSATTTTTIPTKGTLVIHGTGDVNLDPSYIPNLAANGYAYAWAGLEGLLLADHVTVVNLECAPSDLGTAEPKEFVFRCPTESLSSLC